jgi:hypothetical protein
MIKLGCVHSQDMHDTTGHLVLVYFSGGIFSKKPEGIGYTVYRKKKFLLILRIIRNPQTEYIQ